MNAGVGAIDPDTAGKTNRHACAIRLDGIGILIEGRSGSGKTSLAFGLIEAGRRHGIDAAFVADDQVLLSVDEARLLARAPAPILGKAEIRGYGIASVRAEAQAFIDLVVRIHEDDEIERMPEPAFATILGVTLPQLDVPSRHEAQAVRIVMANLARKIGFAL